MRLLCVLQHFCPRGFCILYELDSVQLNGKSSVETSKICSCPCCCFNAMIDWALKFYTPSEQGAFSCFRVVCATLELPTMALAF